MTDLSELNSIKEIKKKLSASFSKKTQENMKAKKEKIQNHFINAKNIDNIALTISSEPLSKTIIGGYSLKITAKQSIKPLLVAHEAYCLDDRSAHPLSPLLFSLMHMYLLDFVNTPISMHFTSPIALTLAKELLASDPITKSIKILLQHFPRADISPCLKGPFFERMQTKIQQIKLRETNDLAILDFQFIANHLSDES